MKAMKESVLGLALLAVLAPSAVLSVGCGAAAPPAARTSAAAATSAPPVQTASQAITESPSATDVAISDEIRSKCGIADGDAYFAFDSARLTSSDRTPLDQVVQCFTRGPLAGHTVKLVGRADPRGPSDYNLTLGESRADAVAAYLGTRGMAKGKAQPTSRGSLDANGTDESGWQHDRRVDILLGN
jgi:peptidoglycan-associated lipoprotein